MNAQKIKSNNAKNVNVIVINKKQNNWIYFKL